MPILAQPDYDNALAIAAGADRPLRIHADDDAPQFGMYPAAQAIAPGHILAERMFDLPNGAPDDWLFGIGQDDVAADGLAGALRATKGMTSTSSRVNAHFHKMRL